MAHHVIDGICCDSFSHKVWPAMRRAGIAGEVLPCAWNWSYWWLAGGAPALGGLCGQNGGTSHVALLRSGRCWNGTECMRHIRGQMYDGFCSDVERRLAAGDIAARFLDCHVPHVEPCVRPGIRASTQTPATILLPILKPPGRSTRCRRNINLDDLLPDRGRSDTTIHVFLFALAVAEKLTRKKPKRPEDWEALVWAVIMVGDLGNMIAWHAFVAADVDEFARAYDADDILSNVLDVLGAYGNAWLEPGNSWPRPVASLAPWEAGLGALYSLWVRGRPNSNSTSDWVARGKRSVGAMMLRLRKIEDFKRDVGRLTLSFAQDAAFSTENAKKAASFLSLPRLWLRNCFVEYSDPNRGVQFGVVPKWAWRLYHACVTLMFAERLGADVPPQNWFRDSLVIDEFLEVREVAYPVPSTFWSGKCPGWTDASRSMLATACDRVYEGMADTGIG